MWPDNGPLEGAYHEAGHAVAMVLLDVPFTKVVATDEEKGVINEAPHPDFLATNFSAPSSFEEARNLQWRPEALELISKMMVTLAAGPLAQIRAEEKAPPDDVHEFYMFGGGQDAAWIRGYALGLAAYETEDDHQLLELKRRFIRKAVQDANHLISRNWSAISAVAQQLLEEKTLSRGQVNDLMGGVG